MAYWIMLVTLVCLKQDTTLAIREPGLSSHPFTPYKGCPRTKGCRCKDDGTGLLVDCSGSSLDFVPDLPNTSREVRLDNNNIHNVSGYQFQHMKVLQLLNLSCNPIKFLSIDAFRGLTNLKHLLMEETLLQFQTTSLEHLLKDSSKLVELSYTFTGDSCSGVLFPVIDIKPLVKVQNLTIDAYIFMATMQQISSSINAEVKNLTVKGVTCYRMPMNIYNLGCFRQLQVLTFTGKVVSVNYDVLRLTPNLEELYFYHVEPYTLTISRDNQSSAIKYDLTSVVHNVTHAVRWLRKLRVLSFYSELPFSCWQIAQSGNLIDPILIHSDTITSIVLKDMCIHFHPEVTDEFPHTLIRLDIAGNCIYSKLIQDIMVRHPELEILDARNYAGCHNRNTPKLLSPRQVANFLPVKIKEFYFSYCSTNCSNLFSEIPFTFENIEVFELSWQTGIQKLSDKFFLFKNSSNLEYLDLTGNNITYIDGNILRGKEKLKTLRLSHNRLGEMGSNLRDVWKDHTQLEILLLSNNTIKNLTDDVFQDMTSLREIDLSLNSFSEFPKQILPLHSLRKLNLSNNELQTIPKLTRTRLDKIQREGGSLVIDMTGNPLRCTCHTIDFLQWILTSQVKIVSLARMSCVIMSNCSYVSMARLDYLVNSLKQECDSKALLYIAVTASVAVVIMAVATALAYRYRWRLRYLYYMARMRFSEKGMEYERIFDYDAFISYASEDFEVARAGCMDELEGKRDLKCFIHERDFQPGQTIAYNISRGIHASKRSVLFVSEAFLKSEWCLYELNIARMEALYAKRTVLLIVILEKDVISQLPVEIIDLIRTVTYLEYPEHKNSDDVMVFWNKLTDFVQQM